MTSSSSINLSRSATRTLGDVCKLVEEGFDYFTEMDDIQIFRKHALAKKKAHFTGKFVLKFQPSHTTLKSSPAIGNI